MSEQSTHGNDPSSTDGAAELDDAASQDIEPGGDGKGGSVGTPASSDPAMMTDSSPDELGGTAGPGGAG